MAFERRVIPVGVPTDPLADSCLDVIVESWEPFITLSAGKDGSLFASGPLLEIFDIIVSRLGSCYKLVVTKDRIAGVALPDGTWNGHVGALNRSEADMCCFLTMSVQRKEVIDFSEPVYQEEFILTYKRPVLEPDITGFIKPFAPLTWFYLAVGMLLVFGMMALMHRGSSLVQFARGSAVRRTSKGGVATSIERSAQWTLSALFSQAVPWEPSMTSTRVMAGLWLLTSFVLGTVYRSNLKAMLIIPLVRLPFDTVKELADSSVPLYITHGSFLHQLIVETPASQPIGQLRKQMVAHRNVISQVNMLRSGKVAYAGLRLPFLIYLNYDFAQTGKCMTYFFSERIFQSASVSCGFPKGSPLKDKIDTIILRLKATGIINYLATRELTHVKACLLPVQNDVSINNLQTLKLKDFYGIFIVYFAGMALSSLICMVELLLGRLSPQTSPHPRPARIPPLPPTLDDD